MSCDLTNTKCLYVSSLSVDPEIPERTKTGKTVMGFGIYHFAAVKAIVKYSNRKCFLLPEQSYGSRQDPRDAEWFRDNRERFIPVSEHQYNAVSKYDCLTFWDPGPGLENLCRVRRLSGASYAPITGMIHAISYSSQLWSVFRLVTCGLTSHDALICSSRAGKKALQAFISILNDRMSEYDFTKLRCPLRLPIIPLGIDTDAHCVEAGNKLDKTHTNNSEPVCLYFGRFSAASKADLFPLIYAFAIARRVTGTGRLLLAGDDTHFHMAGELDSFARDLDCAEHVQVAPNPTRDQKQQLYGLADIFVSPSDSLQETFGITLLEAMAAGLPVIASDWDGYKDTVVHGETGFLVSTSLPAYGEAFDRVRGTGAMLSTDLLASTTSVDVKQISHYMATLFKNESLRRSMGKAGQQRARNLYDWPKVVAQYDQLWDELEAEGRAARQARVDDPGFLDLDQYPYMDVFSDYGSRTTTLRDFVLLDEEMWPPKVGVMKRLCEPRTWFDPGMFEALANVMRHGPITIEALVQAVCPKSEMEALGAISHVYRLAKYGLCSIELWSTGQRQGTLLREELSSERSAEYQVKRAVN